MEVLLWHISRVLTFNAKTRSGYLSLYRRIRSICCRHSHCVKLPPGIYLFVIILSNNRFQFEKYCAWKIDPTSYIYIYIYIEQPAPNWLKWNVVEAERGREWCWQETSKEWLVLQTAPNSMSTSYYFCQLNITSLLI
jgi:hypothetical protein